MSRPFLRRRKRIAKRTRARARSAELQWQQRAPHDMVQMLSGFEYARLGHAEVVKCAAIAGMLAADRI